MAREIRYLSGAQFRAVGANRIEGYAAVFNSRADLGGFVEVVNPGCFARAIREKQDVRCLFNHSDNTILGRTKSRTLQLAEDSTGLHFECRLPATQAARDVYASIERGDIDQCSFGFIAVHERWTESGGQALRELLDVDLFDVSPVTFPAYSDTSVSTRGLWPDGIPHGVRTHQRGGHIKAESYRFGSSHGPEPILDPALETARALARVRLARIG